MGRRLCVLGGTGFLGEHVVRAARAAGHGVVAAARRPPERRACPFAALDVADADALARLLDELAPSAVVNCAALARSADCDADPERARHLNGEFPGVLARLASERGLRLVHVSTDLVYGDRPAPATGFAEGDEPGPVSVYGRTKLSGERAVLAADPRAVVARLPLLCGDSSGRGLGAGDSVVAAVERGERPRLFVDEWRTPLDVSDAAVALVELAGADPRGILHVAGPTRMTRLELGVRALRAAGYARAEELVVAARRGGEHAGRPADVALDATRARALLRAPLREPYA